MDKKLSVYDEVVVECTAPWLEAPQTLILPHNGRTFEVQVRWQHLHAAALSCVIMCTLLVVAAAYTWFGTCRVHVQY